MRGKVLFDLLWSFFSHFFMWYELYAGPCLFYSAAYFIDLIIISINLKLYALLCSDKMCFIATILGKKKAEQLRTHVFYVFRRETLNTTISIWKNKYYHLLQKRKCKLSLFPHTQKKLYTNKISSIMKGKSEEPLFQTQFCIYTSE